MKIPEPKKLPSGNYRIQLRINGESISVTNRDKKKCVAEAAAIKAGTKEKEIINSMTLKNAVEKYIEIQSAVLSPSTLREYDRFSRTYFQPIINKDISKLTQAEIQSAVNQDSKKYSPKTIKNAHGLLSSVLKMFRPGFALITKLPQKEHQEMEMMTTEEACKFANHIKGMDIELSALLGMQYGLRLSEVTGLKWDDIDLKNGVIKVRHALVMGKDNKLVEKKPKSDAGFRDIIISDYVKSLIEKKNIKDEYVIGMTRYSVYRRYKTELKHAGLPSYSFHSLRHLTASVMLTENIPDKYGMEIMGQATDYTYKHVYQQTMTAEQIAANNKLNLAFERIFAHENAHE
jgi:integrase